MTDASKTLVWLGATRYYLGRMTAAVGSFCDLLRVEWKHLPQETRDLIQRDVEEEFRRDDNARGWELEPHAFPLGMDCDRAEWEKVRKLWRDSHGSLVHPDDDVGEIL